MMIARCFYRKANRPRMKGELKTITCSHCGYTWTPRVSNPQCCPKCKKHLLEVKNGRGTSQARERSRILEKESNVSRKNIERLLKFRPGANAVYEVEKEVFLWAKMHAEFFLSRYAKGRSKHWSKNERRNIYVGLLGQKVFDVICQQLAVAKDHNDPVVDWRRKKSYDFKIPDLGTVEVKTFDHYCKKILVKASEWHGNDFLVVFRLTANPSTMRMEGWLTKEQVEALPISKKGERYTPFAAAYIADFDRLNPASEFISMLQKKTID